MGKEPLVINIPKVFTALAHRSRLIKLRQREETNGLKANGLEADRYSQPRNA